MLALIAVLVFLGSVHGEFVWDDIFLVQTNTRLGESGYWWHAIQSPFPYVGPETQGRWGTGMYRPLISLIYGAEYQLWGLRTTGYHVVNLALHASCSILVLRWVRGRLAGEAPEGIVRAAAAIGALVFAVHPTRAESVAWISGCTDLWMTLWILLGLMAWSRFPGIAGALVTGGAGVLALACKENAAVLPLLLAMDGVLRSESVDMRRSALLRSGITLILLIPALLVRFWLVPFGEHAALQVRWSALLPASLGTFAGYLRMMVWPWPPSASAGFLPRNGESGGLAYPPGQIALGILGVLALIVLAFTAKRRAGVRVWLADLTWVVFPLVPNLIPTNDWHAIAERNLYLPFVGVAAVLARAIVAARRRSVVSWTGAAVGAVALCVVFMQSAGAHARRFASNDALWSYETRLHPMDTLGLTNLADVRSGQGRLEEARLLEERAIRSASAQQLRRGILEDWLESEIAAAGTEERELQRLRTSLDAMAANSSPPGAAGTVYNALDPDIRDFLRRSASFRVARALVTAGVGDFEQARLEIETVSPTDQPLRRDVLASRAISILAASGDVTKCNEWLTTLPVDTPLRAALSRLLAAASAVRAGDPPPAIASARLGLALLSGGDPLVTRAALRRALLLAPDAAPLVASLITIDVELRRLSEAQDSLAVLMRLDPRLAAEADPAVQALAAAETRNRLASLAE